ncbi:undecaprenyldiphospho-muramoylpentapeptide beta-N-acetylglucosaminyltransferase [Flavobacterium sp.]|uniref:undecaprenyldiphospho-muramoylpentapeptide beta-N-acetylglucosaminyltransferase n=1 Tax=Flavobacterium sp. TaxID=239 RepID=UPI0035283995
MEQLKFIISGGGTGGHIYPAIAIANELKERFPNAEFLFVGAKDKMEMQKVPQAGYKIEGLWISGIQRKLSLQNLMFPIKLLSSLWKSYRIIKKFKPNVVIGTGGFASGAVLKVASMAGIPTVIQEQNSYPGITNKLLANKAQSICVAYENMEQFFPKDKVKLTGNPVRQDLIFVDDKRIQGLTYFELNSDKRTLLVLGGSLGARRINQLIEKELEFILSLGIQIIWQCGKLYYETYKHWNEKENVHVFAFIDKMDFAYAAADFIISRSGASSISELCIVGKPTILIPSPNVAEDHQTKNALALSEKKAAILIKETELDDKFKTTFADLVPNDALQEKLSKKIHKKALPNATKEIAEEVVKQFSKK